MRADLRGCRGVGLRIRCAICDKPVDRVEQWRRDYSATTEIVVYCHDYVDRMSLSDYDLMHLSRDELRQFERSEGVAFTTKRIVSSPSPVVPGLGE